MKVTIVIIGYYKTYIMSNACFHFCLKRSAVDPYALWTFHRGSSSRAQL